MLSAIKTIVVYNQTHKKNYTTIRKKKRYCFQKLKANARKGEIR